MSKLNKIITIIIGLFVLSTHLDAQTSNAFYYMDNMPYRHFINPSIQPNQNFYLSLPVIGYTNVNMENNSVSLKDIFQNDAAGNTVYFLNPTGDKNRFFNALQPVTMANLETKINLFGAGFRLYDNYFTLDISQRAFTQAFMPRDVFKLLLYGTPDLSVNNFNMKNFALNAQAFTDISIGFARTPDKRLYLGGKLKLLLGNNNKSFSHSKLNINANIDEWNINGSGVINSSGADELSVYGRFDSVKYTSQSIQKMFTVAGLGVGADLGMSYRINKDLTFSASITDLGFINWKKNSSVTKYNIDYTFGGLQKEINTGYTFQDLLDSLGTSFQNAKDVSSTSKSYNTYLLPKLYVGIEQNLFDNLLSVALLSRTMYGHQAVNEELTASVNVRPICWMDASLTTSLLNGRFNTIGAGLGIKTGPLYWFTAMDYMGFDNVPIPLKKMNPSMPDITLKAPYNSQAFNISMGVAIVFNNFNLFKSKKIDPFEEEDRELRNTGYRRCKCSKNK